MKRKPIIIQLSASLAAVLATSGIRAEAGALAGVREKIHNLATEAEKLIDQHKDGLTPEASSQIENLHNQIADLQKTERLLERQAGFENYLKTVPPDERRRLQLQNIGVEGREDINNLEQFSFVRFVRNISKGQPLEGIERELVQDGQQEALQNGLTIQGNMLPLKALYSGGTRAFRNDLTAGGVGSGAEVIKREPLRPIVDLLFEAMQLRNVGATVLTGLKGTVPFPKMGRSSQRPVPLAENAAATELNPTTAIVPLNPHRIPAFIELSQQLLIQDDVSIEAWVRKYLAEELMQTWETQAINGNGSAPNLRGVLNTVGIGSVPGGTNGAAPTRTHIVRLETEVANANALRGNPAYLTNSKVRGKLKETETFTNSGIPVWGDSNLLNGYRAEVSNNVPSNLTKGSASNVCSAILFGHWADLVLGQWGGLEVLSNPYSRDTEGLVRLNAAIYVDAAVLRPESFAAMQDALTT